MIIFRTTILIFVLWILGLFWFTFNIVSMKPKIDKADAIVVLTGARGRIDAGIKLLVEGHAPKLFVSGVGKNALLKDLSKYLDFFAPAQLEQLKDSIILGHAANSTEENAKETKEWLQKYNLHKIILVTSDYHTPRSLLLFEEEIPGLLIIPYPLAPSFVSLRLVFLEYNKYLFYHLKRLF